MKAVYTRQGSLHGYVDGNVAYNDLGQVVGYAESGVVRNRCRSRLGYVNGYDILDYNGQVVANFSGGNIKDRNYCNIGYIAGDANFLELSCAAALLTLI